MERFQNAEGNVLGSGDNGICRLAAQIGHGNLESVFLGHICFIHQSGIQRQIEMPESIFVAADAVAFTGKSGIAGKQCNLAVSVFQKGFCDGIYGAVIVKAEKIHIQVIGTPFQKNSGYSEVSDSIHKKIRVLWLAGNED